MHNLTFLVFPTWVLVYVSRRVCVFAHLTDAMTKERRSFQHISFHMLGASQSPSDTRRRLLYGGGFIISLLFISLSSASCFYLAFHSANPLQPNYSLYVNMLKKNLVSHKDKHLSLDNWDLLGSDIRGGRVMSPFFSS